MLELFPQSIQDALYVRTDDNRPRNLDILDCRLKGSDTLEALAKKHGLTRERVRQIEMRGRRVLEWQFRLREQAWQKQGQLLATIQTLEKEATDFARVRELVKPYLFPGEKPDVPIVYLNDLALGDTTVRLRNGLQSAGIKTLNGVAALLEKDDYEFLKLKNLGRTCLAEAKQLLIEHGIWEAEK